MGCSLKSVVSPLPAIVREGTVGFRHPVHVFTLLDGVPPAIRRVKQLGREPLRHRLFVTFACRRNQPADTQRLPAHVADFDRHLIGGAADAARADLHRRPPVLNGLRERPTAAEGGCRSRGMCRHLSWSWWPQRAGPPAASLLSAGGCLGARRATPPGAAAAPAAPPPPLPSF